MAQAREARAQGQEEVWELAVAVWAGWAERAPAQVREDSVFVRHVELHWLIRSVFHAIR